jgi:hypothetical protein
MCEDAYTRTTLFGLKFDTNFTGRFHPTNRNEVKPMLKYCAAAGVLGCGWFVVLLVPGVTREWLLADVFQNIGCLVVASIIVAIATRKFLAAPTRSASTWSEPR